MIREELRNLLKTLDLSYGERAASSIMVLEWIDSWVNNYYDDKKLSEGVLFGDAIDTRLAQKAFVLSQIEDLMVRDLCGNPFLDFNATSMKILSIVFSRLEEEFIPDFLAEDHDLMFFFRVKKNSILAINSIKD